MVYRGDRARYKNRLHHVWHPERPFCRSKGKAGSPYAIKDYYDIDPDLADNIQNRMSEFEDLVKRTHEAGMKVIIDFVPNHVARQYFSDAREPFVEDLGQTDNVSKAFDVNNNFLLFFRGRP